jgi:two-component sensor histidine kinase/integral membrane sensor domain MASE1
VEPGNITPVWLPSGIMVSAIWLRGYNRWPGVFMGALLGNIWAYFDASTLVLAAKSLLAGSANGCGDALGAVLGVYWLRQLATSHFPFDRVKFVIRFFLSCGVLNAGLSAFFGITALCSLGFLPWPDYPESYLTWWTGDAVGVVILAPVILAWVYDRSSPLNLGWEAGLFTLILLFVSVYSLRLLALPIAVPGGTGSIQLPLFTVAPVLLWPVFRFNRRITFMAITIVATIAVLTLTWPTPDLATSTALTEPLIEFQLFIGIMASTICVTQAVVHEREQTALALHQSRHDLECQVAERTASLVQTNQDLRAEIQERKTIEKQLQQTLHEKGVLLAEIHHRVKNNLQIISSLLRLQVSQNPDQENLVCIQDSQCRVQAMALIHEQLYRSDNLNYLDFREYISSLVHNLFHCFKVQNQYINLEIEVSDINLDLDTAIPCGLIINEVVTNSLKYAFPQPYPKDKAKQIRIAFRAKPNQQNHYCLTLEDNGIGIPHAIDPHHHGSLGLCLIYELTQQLTGEINLDRSQGTKFEISFMALKKLAFS